MKTQLFFKNRTNPNKTITPDCPLLTSHQAAKARVFEELKIYGTIVPLSHENNKEENLLINQMALSIVNQDERAG